MVDLPTLGRPIIATVGSDIASDRLNKSVINLGELQNAGGRRRVEVSPRNSEVWRVPNGLPEYPIVSPLTPSVA